MTQEELAERVGVDKTAVCHWETGLSRPDLSRVPAIAEALDVPVLDLVRGEKAWAVYQQALEAAA